MENYDKSKSTRNSGILKIEERLTELVETDPQNEEIYKLLKKLAYIYINQNKFVYGYNGIDEVCHDVAADVWMAVLNGKKIYAWMYYIGKMIKLSYIPKQKALEHESIETFHDPHLKENIKKMCASSAMSCMKDFDDMQRSFMLEHIGSIIKDTMKHIKFQEGTKEYNCLYVNLCNNLIKYIDGEKPVYFRINESLKPYINILIEQFKKDFRNSGFTESIMDNVDEDIAFALIMDESYIKERKMHDGS
jgi:hypothetical protein